MGNIVNIESWLGKAQLNHVEEVAWWCGIISRKDLVEYFGVSMQQASAIIKKYIELNPNALKYDTSRKRYISNDSMVRIFEHNSIKTDFFNVDSPPWQMITSKTFRHIVLALRKKLWLKIHLNNHNRSKIDEKWIIPLAIGFNGEGLFVRAWCNSTIDFKNFQLSTIIKATWPTLEVFAVPLDHQWPNL